MDTYVVELFRLNVKMMWPFNMEPQDRSLHLHIFTYICRMFPVFVHEAAGNSGLSDAQPIVWLLVVFLGLVQWGKALGVM